MGGARLADIARMGDAIHTVAIGEHMRGPSATLSARTGIPATVLPTLTGLEPSDRLIALLSDLSGRPVPARLRRARSQLVDAILDAHFHFGGKRIAIGADPDLLFTYASLFTRMGAEVPVAVASTDASPLLTQLSCDVLVGDLADLEEAAAAANVDLLVTHAHGRQAADRLKVPLYRVGFPIFDRLGVQHRCTLGYGGTRQLIYEFANSFLAQMHEHHPEDFVDAIPAEPIVEDTRHPSPRESAESHAG
jgi:nitrogenase molybdenum-iron protein NifN